MIVALVEAAQQAKETTKDSTSPFFLLLPISSIPLPSFPSPSSSPTFSYPSSPPPTPAPHRQQEAEARASILQQILEPEAADRLGRIRLVKESRAVDVENRLIMLARSGQLRAKITEEQLKELLGAVSEKEEQEGRGKIVVSRRKDGWDDEDDDLLDL